MMKSVHGSEFTTPPDGIRYEQASLERAAALQKVRAKKGYTYMRRCKAVEKLESELVKRRKVQSKEPSRYFDSGWLCCKGSRGIQYSDRLYTEAQRSRFLLASEPEKKSILHGMLQEKGHFVFNGEYV